MPKMLSHSGSKEMVFKDEVTTKFELYNSLFLTLPFYAVKYTGLALPYFLNHCEEGARKHLSPEEIISSFFSKQSGLTEEKELSSLLFLFIQYIFKVRFFIKNRLGKSTKGYYFQAMGTGIFNRM